MDQISYPIAETFLSPQGEGLFAGTLMQFIRFAGCSVGKPFTNVTERNNFSVEHKVPFPSIYQERCCAVTGEEFLCDTNFRMKERMSTPTLLSVVGKTPRVCLTGGEPLMHNLSPLVSELWKANKAIHIETSGTIDIPDYLIRPFGPVWIAVSPKRGCLNQALLFANEIKILVGDQFDDAILELFLPFANDRTTLWLQPMNLEFQIDRGNLLRCLDIQKRYPEFRISTQMHKIWEVR